MVRRDPHRRRDRSARAIRRDPITPQVFALLVLFFFSGVAALI